MSSSEKPSVPVAQLRDRVRLYLQVMLVIDLTGYISDLFLLLSDAPPELPHWAQLLRWSVTLSLFGGWALARFFKPGDGFAIAVESAITVGIGWTYVRIGQAYPVGPLPQLGAAMSLFGIVLLLVLRAALVPSPTWRTALVGFVAFVGGLAIASRGSMAAFDVNLWESLGFMGAAFIVATTVTSHVIYGLRKQVRDAMQLGQYRLQEKLGAGGMGEVYRAQHTRLRRPTAVKLLPAARSSEEDVARFEQEVQLTAALTHPHTIRIYDYGRTEDGVFYYAMEYLDGANLAQLVAVSGPQPAARVIAILEQVAAALEEAHGAGLVHRDIKPENLMLTRQGLDPDAVKVLDFGLVQHAPSLSDGALDLAGTPLYLAPEVITGQAPASAESDLYALGAVAYFFLTGTHVFAGGGLVETCFQHVHATPEAPSDRLGKAVPADLERLVLACLEKEPQARPQGAARLRQALRECAAHGHWSIAEAEAWWARFGRAIENQQARDRGVDPEAPTVLSVGAAPSDAAAASS